MLSIIAKIGERTNEIKKPRVGVWKIVKILGAGLSGLTAAINLAKAGYQVDVFEKNQEVGGRFNGDLQGLENWSEEEDIRDELDRINLDKNFDLDPFLKVTATNNSKSRNVVTRRPLFYLIKRGTAPGSMDLGLKRQAARAGVNIRFGESISAEQADIVATGPVQDNVVGIVKGITFKTDLKDTAIMLFNDQAGLRGYSYLLVTRGYGCLSTVLLENFQGAEQCFKRAREIFSNMVKFEINDEKPCGGMGCFSLENTFVKGKTLFVGEAAGLQDFLWGFGMRYALKSGYLAAQCIIHDEDYERVARDNFSGKLKAGLVNRYLWEKAGKGNYEIVINHSQRIIDNLRWISNYNVVHRILYPLALRRMKMRYDWL